ncbi:MAG TPA: porin [Candidatus Sulfopaludibacter sp.]|nr:porin [Candidatus Sulfopaludibacter sp.]
MSHLRFGRLLIACLLILPAYAQIVVKNEDVTFKFGVQGQLWADWTQDSSGAQGYQQNFYLRRARLIMSGDIGKDISFFFETDDPKLGITPKNLASGFIIQDALMEWKPTKVFQVGGGLFLVPFTRNGLQSTLSYLTLDVSPISTVTNTTTQSSALRDLGFQFKGFFANERLQYRLAEVSGERDANAHNSLRTVAYLQYDFFDREKGYLFSGTTLGKGKILAVDAGIDRQGAYRGYSANTAAALPVNKGDEIAGQFQYVHYDGRNKFTAIADQNDYLLEAAYYIHQAKFQPFLKYEAQSFVTPANASKDINRAGFGANYYIRNQNLKWTCQYLRAMPRNNPALKAGNELTIQLQLMYF